MHVLYKKNMFLCIVAGKNVEWLVDFRIHQPQWQMDKHVTIPGNVTIFGYSNENINVFVFL